MKIPPVTVVYTNFKRKKWETSRNRRFPKSLLFYEILLISKLLFWTIYRDRSVRISENVLLIGSENVAGLAENKTISLCLKLSHSAQRVIKSKNDWWRDFKISLWIKRASHFLRSKFVWLIVFQNRRNLQLTTKF